MPSIIRSVSLPVNLDKFLNENPRLSASKILQAALFNLQEVYTANPALQEARIELANLKKVYEKQNDFQNKLIQNYAEYLTLNKLFDDFSEKYPL